jgi:hypothetical protein
VTVIAGFTNGKDYAIGADSGAFEDGSYLYAQTKTPKAWSVGGTLIGGVGSFRSIHIAKSSGLDDPHKLLTHLLEQSAPAGWSLLLVTRKAITEVSDEGGVTVYRAHYGAIGAGASIAIGAMAASDKFARSADVVRRAMEITGNHSLYCVPPYLYFSK